MMSFPICIFTLSLLSIYLSYHLIFVEANVTQPPQILFGVNGHPLTQSPYSIDSYRDQLGWIKFMNISYYRFDAHLDPDLTGQIMVRDTKEWDPVLLTELLLEFNIKPLPIIFPTRLDPSNHSIERIYALNFREGTNWARQYRDNFTIIELSNEEDNNCILPNSDGINKSDYNITKVHEILAKLHGFSAGVKSLLGDKLKIIIDFGWVHMGFMQWVVDTDIPFDIVGFHWYSDMGQITRAYKNFTNVLEYVIDTWKKDIWITESNTKNGSMTVNSTVQIEWVTGTLDTVQGYPAVKSYFLYELYDENQFRPSSEAYYGLVAINETSGEKYIKPIGEAYKNYIENKSKQVSKQENIDHRYISKSE